jgi:hypothetical protein
VLDKFADSCKYIKTGYIQEGPLDTGANTGASGFRPSQRLPARPSALIEDTIPSSSFLFVNCATGMESCDTLSTFHSQWFHRRIPLGVQGARFCLLKGIALNERIRLGWRFLSKRQVQV